MFYTGGKFPKWKNNLFIGSLTQRALIRMAFKQPSQAEKREPLLVPLEERIRDVQQSPDGYIYVATGLMDGTQKMRGLSMGGRNQGWPDTSDPV